MKYTNLPKLKDRTVFEKILFVLQLVLSISVIITAILEMTDILNSANDLSQFLLGCMFLVMFLEYRKYNTLQAYFSFAVAIFLIVIFFL